MATLTAPSGSRRKSTAIDMTPMVDLAFLLLTFFVLTTSLNKKMALDLRMPAKEIDNPSAPVNAKKVLTVVLGPQNKIFWYMGAANGNAETTNYSSQGIRKILIEKKANIKGLHVLIKASDHSQYKNMVDLLDEILITGIERYAIINMEKPDEELILSSVTINH